MTRHVLRDVPIQMPTNEELVAALDTAAPPPEEEEWYAEEGFDPGWSPATARIDDISRLLWRRTKIVAEIAEYDRLEQIEFDRLKRAREDAVGPAERRLAFTDRNVEEFAVRAWLDEGKTRWATPNGIIASTKVGTKIVADDDMLADWCPPKTVDAPPDDMFETRSKVFVKHLRKWLDAQVTNGTIQRIVLIGKVSDPDYSETVDETVGFAREFRVGEVGYWMIVETGEVVPGVTWSPGGDAGSGRNFRFNPTSEDS
jgi:hypothetical protein